MHYLDFMSSENMRVFGLCMHSVNCYGVLQMNIMIRERVAVCVLCTTVAKKNNLLYRDTVKLMLAQ